MAKIQSAEFLEVRKISLYDVGLGMDGEELWKYVPAAAVWAVPVAA